MSVHVSATTSLGRAWPSRANSKWLVIIALAIEAYLFTYGRGKLGYYASPVVLLLCALVACGGTYHYARRAEWCPAPADGAGAARGAAVALAWTIGLLLCGVTWSRVLHDIDVRINSSDIIPALTIYTKRLLAGEVIYTPFTHEVGYELLPTYLPGTWLPYLIPELLRLDYRWMSGALLLAGIGAYTAVIGYLRSTLWLTFSLVLLPFVLVYAVLRTEPTVVGYTVEMMIVGYYLLLGAGLLLPSRTLRVIGLLLCMLSRYSLVLWLPLYFGLLLFRSRREALLTAALVGLGVVGLYVIPFMSQDWGMLPRTVSAYTGTALGEWQHLNGNGLPYHLYNGIGMGVFLHRFGSGEMLARVVLLKNIHLILLLTVVGVGALVYWCQTRPRIDYRAFSVISLKLYLTVFYAFIQVPYAYLAMTGFFCSLLLVLVLLGARTIQPSHTVLMQKQ